MTQPVADPEVTPAGEGGPWPVSREPRGGMARGTALLAFVMIGWMFFMMALAAFGGATDSTPQQPVSLGRGVTVTPAEGWTPAADVWEGEAAQVAFKRAGAVAAFAVDAYEGDAQALMDEQLADIESQFSSFRSLPSTSTIIDGGLPAVSILFDGVSGSAELEGELVTATRDGTGVVMLAFAPLGQLRRVQDELDFMLENLVVP